MKSLIKLLVPIILVMSSTSLLVSCDNENLEEEIYYDVSVFSAGGGNVAIENYSETSISVLPNKNITVIAIAEEGYCFAGWFISNLKTPISTDTNYTFIVNEEICLEARFYKKPIAVDLGLSVKWASFNVGASSPDEYGSYYAWGETEEKDVYKWANYKWCDGDSESLTKYCTRTRYGTVDNKTVLDLEDDVAHVKWGGTWRIPTDNEVYELGCCERERVMLNGVEVYKLTGPNGNSIFLPLTGGYWGKDNSLRGLGALYWTSDMGSTLGRVEDCYANVLCYGVSSVTIVDRSWGLAVRPVCE